MVLNFHENLLKLALMLLVSSLLIEFQLAQDEHENHFKGNVLDWAESVPCLNDRPIVGVLAQFPYNDPHQYLPASYVKFIEMGGARVVPLFSGHPRPYYEKYLRQLNGILLPGGGSPLDHGPYAESVDMILDLAVEMNENGTHFPVLAICLSFEKIIVHYLNNSVHWKTMCWVENRSLNLQFEPDIISNPKKSQLFRGKDIFNANIMKILQSSNVTANYHRVCMERDEWLKHEELYSNFRLISTTSFQNYTFVSTIEHQKYPIFGLAWHPEKNAFEFVVNAKNGNISHDLDAILVAQYFANVFINETRYNWQHFPDKLQESRELIYNYKQYLQYTGKDPKKSYEEVYRFPVEVNAAPKQCSLCLKGLIIIQFILCYAIFS